MNYFFRRPVPFLKCYLKSAQDWFIVLKFEGKWKLRHSIVSFLQSSSQILTMLIPVWLKLIILFQSLLLSPQICYKTLISSLLYTCFQTLMKKLVILIKPNFSKRKNTLTYYPPNLYYLFSKFKTRISILSILLRKLASSTLTLISPKCKKRTPPSHNI